MEQVLENLGINVEKMKAKPIHSRIETQEILDVSFKTLRNFERKGILQRTPYKNKSFYSNEQIKDCIAKQIGLNSIDELGFQNTQWSSMW